jgi:hypothetical protein
MLPKLILLFWNVNFKVAWLEEEIVALDGVRLNGEVKVLPLHRTVFNEI